MGMNYSASSDKEYLNITSIAWSEIESGFGEPSRTSVKHSPPPSYERDTQFGEFSNSELDSSHPLLINSPRVFRLVFNLPAATLKWMGKSGKGGGGGGEGEKSFCNCFM